VGAINLGRTGADIVIFADCWAKLRLPAVTVPRLKPGATQGILSEIMLSLVANASALVLGKVLAGAFGVWRTNLRAHVDS
jgi:hypothetical protein